ncbi:MAG: guanylate kinase, partial [Alphaproteobacteria bacterium]|nr:guanylate kinase [Alphaproteobacteria bacterium]
DYRFVDLTTFNLMVNRREFLEWAKVFDHYYGTPRAAVERDLAVGRDVLFDIDWQGTQTLAQAARADLVSIFVLPPSTAELERRLRTRARDSAEEVGRRMARAADEMSHWPEYDYVIVNRDLDESVARVRAILWAERLRRQRQTGLAEFVKSLREGQ